MIIALDTCNGINTYMCVHVCAYKILTSNIYSCDHMWFPSMNFPEQILKNVAKL